MHINPFSNPPQSSEWQDCQVETASCQRPRTPGPTPSKHSLPSTPTDRAQLLTLASRVAAHRHKTWKGTAQGNASQDLPKTCGECSTRPARSPSRHPCTIAALLRARQAGGASFEQHRDDARVLASASLGSFSPALPAAGASGDASVPAAAAALRSVRIIWPKGARNLRGFARPAGGKQMQKDTKGSHRTERAHDAVSQPLFLRP